MTLSRSSERMTPVLPPESIAAETAFMLSKSAETRLLRMVGAPVPPPMVVIFGIRAILPV